ncbi:MAG: LysR family transcriptional regulator [Paucimonas sp.]|jgi:DNA-binding transcriptional LysR family regulator|nr:LysR family transcriptional regulator [Paucimonas sp.]
MKHLHLYRCIADVARRGSIRKAAEHLHLTPSALTRKIQDFEEELGTAIFERLPQGMRLTDAGELLLRHIQNQGADFELLLTKISDLEGVRRGHVSLASAQAFVDSVLPEEIATFRLDHPKVSFSVEGRDNLLGINALVNYEADLALLIDPPPAAELYELIVKKQPLCAVVSKDHPLASSEAVRLRECCDYTVAMPGQSLAIGSHLNEALVRRQLSFEVVVESDSLEFLRNFVTRELAITFLPLSSIPKTDDRIRACPISPLDLEPLRVVLAQLKGRTLSTAARKFAEQLMSQLADLN